MVEVRIVCSLCGEPITGAEDAQKHFLDKHGIHTEKKGR